MQDAGGDITLDKALFNDTRGVELLAYDTQFSGMVLGPDGEPVSLSQTYFDLQGGMTPHQISNKNYDECIFI